MKPSDRVAAISISPEQWNKMVELFHAAREKSGGERVALLDSALSDDSSLRLVVEQMLRDHEAPGSFLNESPLQSFAPGEVPPSAAAAGRRFGRYELLAPIGRGGMGEVWVAHDTELERPVALKFLAPDAAGGRAVERLRREARTVSALNHPNIVTVHEVIAHEEAPIIVMELVDGNSLRELCGTPQALNDLIHIGLQIARALGAAHAYGIIHRDIKPENILVRRDGYVKVLDFGLARHLAGDTLASSSNDLPGGTLPGGTLRYMSPEQARGESPSPASDIFSFGLVLYELATGQHAFPRDSPGEAMQAILNEQAVAPSSVNPLIPRPLDSLILSMLATESAARPSAEGVEKRFGEILLQLEGSAAAVTSRPREPASRRIWLTMLAASLIVVAAVGWVVSGRRNSPEFGELRIQPLTSQAGWEGSPAVSPDGKSIAFTWGEKLDRPKQMYVERLTENQPVKLTSFESEGNVGPLAWSPDGTRIAFKSVRGYGEGAGAIAGSGTESGAIYSIARTGGDKKKVLDLIDANFTSAIDWSPDGTQLAFSDAVPQSNLLAIYLFDLRTGEKRKLTSPAAEDFGDWDPKFSPDGRTVAFKRVRGFWADDIYTMPVAGGPIRRVTGERRGIWGHAWTPDGRSLILSCQRGGTVFGLWRFPLKSQARPERILEGGIDAITPATGRRTSRLAWVNQLQDLNIYRISAAGGGVPEKLIASTRRDQDATYSPEGRIAFVSDRSGSREIWLAKADGSGQVRVTNLHGPSIDHLQWSPDGHRLAFDSGVYGHSGIFALQCDSAGTHFGEPKRLSSERSAEAIPGWSADGKFLYFASDRTGRWEVWKQPAFGGLAMQVTHNGGYTARESIDGRWLYFSKLGREGIWRMHVSKSGGEPESSEGLVMAPPYHVQPERWTLTPDEIVFIERAANGRPAAIRAYRISTKQTRLILALTEGLTDMNDIGVSVSPDSQWVLYSQLDRSGSNVMVAENIR